MGLLDWFHHLLDASALLASLGPWVLPGLAAIVFIESGVLFPFLPGDSLLVAATILRDALGVSVWQVVLVASVAAVAGDQTGFWLGRRFGRRLFRADARVLRTDRLETAEAFFDRHGPLALVLGRFVPIVRTYVPLASGTADMPFRRFVAWNTAGALGWVVSMALVGTLLGQIPGITHSIEGIALVVVGLSVLPIAVRAWTQRASRHRAGAVDTEAPLR